MYRNHNKTKFELRSLFKRHLDSEEYRKLTHFLWCKKIKSNIPGTWTMYMWHNNGIAIATNAICINKFLVEHDLPKKRPMTEKHIQMKIRVNGTDKIDNRTKKWTYYKIKKRTYAPRTTPTPGEELRELVWKMYVEDNLTAVEISHKLGYTAPNIYYHLRKKYQEIKSQELDVLDR